MRYCMKLTTLRSHLVMSPIGRDEEGHLYAAQTDSRGRPSRQRCGRGGALSTGLITVVPAGRAGKSRVLGWRGLTRAARSERGGTTRWAHKGDRRDTQG